MKRLLTLLIVIFVFVCSMGLGDAKGASKSSGKKDNAETIKAGIIENCGLDADWTAYMAVYGYVYGDCLYFYNSDWDDMNIYKISKKDYKLKKFVSKVYEPRFCEGFVFYNKTEKAGMYAKNLTTGKVMKLAKDGGVSETYVYNDTIYYVDSKDYYNKKLYMRKTDGTGKKLLASGISDGSLGGNEEGAIVIYEDRIYYMKEYGQNFWPKDGKKIYSCKLDGTDKKLMKKVKATLGVVGLMIRDQDLLIGYYDNETKGADRYQRYNGLYRFDGTKFVNIGYIEDYPQYEWNFSNDYFEHYQYMGRMSDGYLYYQDAKKYDIDILETGRGLKIDRKDKKGNIESFAEYPYFITSMAYDFQMSNGYLIAYGWEGEHRESVLIFDNNGNMLAIVYTAGFGDESTMKAAISGNCAYIIHEHSIVKEISDGKEKYKEVNICQKIDFAERKKAYEGIFSVTLKKVQNQILNELKSEGLDYKPGSEKYGKYINQKVKEMKSLPVYDKKRLLWNVYADAYNAVFEDYIWVLRKTEQESSWGKYLKELDISRMLSENDSIVYDAETELYYFEPSKKFLKLTVGDIYKNIAG